MALNDSVIINAGIGGWYPRGSKRLHKSLIYHGWGHDILTFTDWPNNEFDKSNIYNLKASVFNYAIDQGYKKIIWMDCSAWAIKDPQPILDIINTDGYYFQRSGYNCAQTCNDNSLRYFGITRDRAEKFDDTSTAVFGVHMDNPLGSEFIERWIESCRAGVFNGSRLHDNQSQDPRFLFHRQDQSAASLLIGLMHLKQYNLGELVTYYSPEMSESIVVALRGM
jgi:hypothetical protein